MKNETKKLKKKLAKMALNYIENHEGRNNSKQRRALAELNAFRAVMRSELIFNDLSEAIEAAGIIGVEFLNFEKQIFESDLKASLEPKDYKNNLYLISDIESSDYKIIIKLARLGYNIKNMTHILSRLKVVSKRESIPIIKLIDLGIELKSYLA